MPIAPRSATTHTAGGALQAFSNMPPPPLTSASADLSTINTQPSTLTRITLPAATEYEAQLKAAKEKKARESVPKF